MNMNITPYLSYKFFVSGLFGILLLSFVFFPTSQTKADIGTVCDIPNPSVACGSYPCIKESGSTLQGVCSGPCDKNTTDAVCKSSVGNQVGWANSVCTATKDKDATTKGVCIEAPAYLLGEGLKEGEQLLGIVRIATNWIFAIFVILAIIFVLLAAFQFVTGGGDEAKISEARQKLIWAAVGIAVALASRGLVPVIRQILGG